MSDVFSKSKRSWVMSRICGRDTKPERLLRSLLHRLGYRFTVNARNNRKLPGRPDIVMPKWGLVIFVHGCFWHGHPGCRDFRIPKTRSDWWREKINGNRARDQRNAARLEELGWRVVTIWACAMKNQAATEELLRRLPALVEGSEEPVSEPKVAEERRPYGAG